MYTHDQNEILTNVGHNSPVSLTHSHSFLSLSLCVQGYKQRKAYIATQGPLSETVVDMWRMIWESDCCCIIMLCMTVENSQVGHNTMIPLSLFPLDLSCLHCCNRIPVISSSVSPSVFIYLPFLSDLQESSHCFWPQSSREEIMYGKIRIRLKTVSTKMIDLNSQVCKTQISYGHTP